MDCVDVDIAVFTNLASDPAEARGDPDELLAAKGALFRRLTDPSRQRAIINLDGAALSSCLT
jgi:UDP-N-acetylmuramyl tripeptide synthase